MSKMEEPKECFEVVQVRQPMTLQLPSYINKIHDKVLEYLNSRVLHSSPDLDGILLCYSNPQVLNKVGNTENELVHFDLEYQAFVFKFTQCVGKMLSGKVNHVRDSYVRCLIYDCFNAHVELYEGPHDHLEVGEEIKLYVTELNIVGDLVWLKGELL